LITLRSWPRKSVFQVEGVATSLIRGLRQRISCPRIRIFAVPALAGYTPQDFLQLVREYRIGFHEKHKGQLFCDDSSESIIQMLRQECLKGQVSWRMPCSVQSIGRTQEGFVLRTSQGDLNALQVVIATGGMAIPQLGSTDYALRMARHFGLKVIEPHPALVPLTFDGRDWKPFSALSGMALEVEVSTGGGGGGGRASSVKPFWKICCSRTAACPGRVSCRFPATGNRVKVLV
jgi:predicted flavoprotein YhiN